MKDARASKFSWHRKGLKSHESVFKKFFKAIWPAKSPPTLEQTFKNTRPKNRRRKWWPILGIIILGFIFYGFYWLNTRDFLILKNIIVSTAGSGQQDVGIIQDLVLKQWQEKRWGIISQNFYFAFSTNETKKNIQAVIAVENLKIETFFPSVVRIEVEQLPARVIAQAGARFYAVNSKGLVLKELSDMKTAPTAYPRVLFPAENNFTISQNLFKEPVVDFLSRAHIALASAPALKKIIDHWEYLELPRPEVNIKTTENFIIKFDALDNSENQIANVELFLTQQLKNPEARKGLEYIDARFGNKLFYK